MFGIFVATILGSSFSPTPVGGADRSGHGHDHRRHGRQVEALVAGSPLCGAAYCFAVLRSRYRASRSPGWAADIARRSSPRWQTAPGHRLRHGRHGPSARTGHAVQDARAGGAIYPIVRSVAEVQGSTPETTPTSPAGSRLLPHVHRRPRHAITSATFIMAIVGRWPWPPRRSSASTSPGTGPWPR
ncbi:hypothetical protein QJS66_21355 [Kocuria rhizophila]|nr:hypothetical protein QJS66_21355 [Kocuria rhizophila]